MKTTHMTTREAEIVSAPLLKTCSIELKDAPSLRSVRKAAQWVRLPRYIWATE